MGVPATTGQLRTKIEDMEIGDYAICRLGSVNATNQNTVYEFGTSTMTEIPLTGSPTFSGSFYMVKVDRGLLVADRVVRHTIKWDDLNSYKLIEGKQLLLDDVSGILRSLTGGVAFVDANGNSSLTDLGLGAFPTNNEWDRYIVNFPTELIQSGKTLDDVFHWKDIFTFVQETPVNWLTNLNGVAINTWRNYRGFTTSKRLMTYLSSNSSSQVGFRPVFEWNEV